VNVTVEHLGPCRKLVRFEVEAKAVDVAFAATAEEYQRAARLPGFRPGKAPREMVLRTYDKEIQEETKKKLIGTTYHEGVKEQKLNVLRLIDLEEIQFGRGKDLQFAATVDLAPEFELPEYRGLVAKRELAVVTPADIERALNVLRAQQNDFKVVARAAKEGDFVIVNYTGTCDGKPITETAPTARGLTEQKNFWIEMKAGSFVPGFFEQLTGAKAGDKLTVNVDFPADFVTPQLAGKKGAFAVEVVEVKERLLPPLDDEFAKKYGAENLERLREGVRSDLQNELNTKQKRGIRNQLVKAMLDKVNFDLPESTVEAETRNIVYEIVNENQRRGVARELIEQEKDGIYNSAQATARDRVKIGFLFHRVSEKEGIRATNEEVNARIVGLAQAYQMPVDKFVKELEKREGMPEIYQQIIHEKVLNFLHENARIEDAPVSAPPA
jgi:trigger factor